MNTTMVFCTLKRPQYREESMLASQALKQRNFKNNKVLDLSKAFDLSVRILTYDKDKSDSNI